MTALIHPESEANAVAMADLVERLTSRIQARESIDFDAVVRDHPEHAEELRRLMPCLPCSPTFRVPLGPSRLSAAATRHLPSWAILESAAKSAAAGWDRLRISANFAQPAGGAEGATVRRDDGPATFAAFPPRSSGGRPLAPSQYRSSLRRRLRTRCALLCHAVDQRPIAGSDD